MTTKNDININIDTAYLESQSVPENNQYVFSYTITIANVGSVAAKLLDRHWTITDANGKIEEVRGEGVVGEQPLLQPGEAFRYTSGAILETSTGCMEGEYLMINDDKEHFMANIPPFSLAVPNTLH
ncbi:MAG: Co2+/Mg2+ efflux protein ApaG [Gammaproteobacteria bacterium]